MKNLSALFKLWPYLKPHTSTMVISLLLSIPMAALRVGPAPAVKLVIDQILVKKDERTLYLLPVIVLGYFSLNFVFRFFHQYLIRAAANRLIQSIRNDFYSHLLRLSIGYFNEAQGGILLSRVINDVQTIVKAVSSLILLVREPITFLAYLGYAFYLNWKLTLMTLAILPLLAVLISNAGRHSKRYSNRILDNLAEMTALLSESISGMRVIQAFGLEGFLRGQFMKLNRDFTRTALKAIRLEEMSAPAVEFVSGMAIAFVLFFGGKEVLAGHMTPGDVLALFACFGLMLQPIRTLNELNITFNQCAVAAENVLEVLHEKPEVLSPRGAKALPAFQDEIEFRHVDFQYQGSERGVLKNFTLKVKRGEVIALVGASGAGKSTVLSLIPRFFDPTQGEITIDGINIREVSLESLRAQTALVTQEVFLFHDTVRANLKAGRHSLTEEKILKAAEAAQALPFIEKLPKGLDTVIGDRGQKLSGGERQRLSIARAILKDAPILLLDEATSALDSENERLVQAALDRLLVGKTAIVVAHRLSTIRKASRILVMDKGLIVEEGKHDELLARGGFYAKALALQEGFA